MGYFPRPLPDEVIGSLFAYACIELGLTPGTLLRQLVGVSHSYNDFLSSSLMLKFERRTGLDAEELLWGHTIFPYAVAFLSQAEVLQCRDKALDPRWRGLDRLGWLIKSVAQGLPFRRMCAQCIADDLGQHGRSYWHRAHQLPGVYRCDVHDTVLLSSGIGVRHKTRRIPVEMPEGVPGRQMVLRLPTVVLDVVQHRALAALGRRTGYREDWQTSYRARAFEKGYGMRCGDLANAQLATDLFHFFTEPYLNEVGCGFGSYRANPWPELMVMERLAVPVAPAKHVLLDAYLELCPNGRKLRGYEKPPRGASAELTTTNAPL
jgi:hypothetical protein